MSDYPRKPFEREAPAIRRRTIPPATVMLGSCATAIPVVATFPVLPPLGLLLLLGWRLLRPDVFRVWAPLPLGLFDDLLSGQPLGSAMLLWTLSFFVLDMVDARVAWRAFSQDWMLAAGAIAFCLIGGRLIAAPIGAHVDGMLLFQIAASILLFPLVSRVCAWLDRRRLSA